MIVNKKSWDREKWKLVLQVIWGSHDAWNQVTDEEEEKEERITSIGFRKYANKVDVFFASAWQHAYVDL